MMMMAISSKNVSCIRMMHKKRGVWTLRSLFILLFLGPFWLMVLSAMNMALDPWLLSPWWLQKMLLREPFEKCRLVSAPFWTLRLWPLWVLLQLLSRVRYRREVLMRALQRVKGNDSELLVLQSMLQLRHFYTSKHCSNIEASTIYLVLNTFCHNQWEKKIRSWTRNIHLVRETWFFQFNALFILYNFGKTFKDFQKWQHERAKRAFPMISKLSLSIIGNKESQKKEKIFTASFWGIFFSWTTKKNSK